MLKIGRCSKCFKACDVAKPCCKSPVLYQGSFNAYLLARDEKWTFPVRQTRNTREFVASRVNSVATFTPRPVGKSVLTLIKGGK